MPPIVSGLLAGSLAHRCSPQSMGPSFPRDQKNRSLTFQASSWSQVGCLCQADPAPSSPIWVLQAGTVKFFLSSRQHHSFSLSGTASRSSLGLEAFQSLKLIGMWSLTIHLYCLMNFLAAASGAIGSPSGPTSVIMNRPSSFFVGPRFVFFCCDDDPDGYKKTFIVFI